MQTLQISEILEKGQLLAEIRKFKAIIENAHADLVDLETHSEFMELMADIEGLLMEGL